MGRLVLSRAALFVHLALACAVLAVSFATPARGQERLIVTSDLTYDVTLGNGMVQVTWDINLVNNDPTTENQEEGRIFFYQSLTLPVLRGAAAISAVSSEGVPLATAVDTSGLGAAVSLTVDFDRRLFYQDSYDFTVSYQLSDVRERSLLVTPFYTFLPLIAAGDEATVRVLTPEEPPWTVEVEPVECAGDVQRLVCSGGQRTYLAAMLEVSRPDATASTSFEVGLREQTVALSLTYFQGEEAFAQHIQELTAAALPLLEDVHGTPYRGPARVDLSQGGRQAVLGYEGVASCGRDRCNIVLSPTADDLTTLHELAHLWSTLYAKRWLSEGFAQLAAEEAAARLPDLARGEPPREPESSIELQLDDWGEVTSVVGADEAELELQRAGYERSLRFLALLRAEAGLESLQAVNRAIAESGRPADSRRFMDLLEDIGGRRLDGMFKLWVFPESVHATLDQRREARDRLAALAASIEGTGLSTRVPDEIREEIAAWRFPEALAALDAAEADLAIYDQLLPRLAELQAAAHAEGLSVGTSIEDRLLDWRFDEARHLLAAAEDAVTAYAAAREKVEAPRTLWQRFGLMGSDPEGRLEQSAAAFGRGDYAGAAAKAGEAADMIAEASDRAFLRLLIVAGVLGLLAVAIGVAFWVSQWRRGELL